MNIVKLIFCWVALFFYSVFACADPWMTGPFLFDSALVVPVGSQNIAMIFESSRVPSIYDSSGTVTTIPTATSDYLSLQYTTGMSSFSDFQVASVYIKNQTEAISRNNLGDTLMQMGFQVLTQGTSHSRPNFRIAVFELFPTGKYTQLNPSVYGTDATGAGSYQTSVEFAFNLLTQLQGTSHYFRASASAIATISSTVALNGDSIYGGDSATVGHITPGNALALDLGGEYTLTQNWVVAFESFVLAQRASNFTGYLGPNASSFNSFISKDKHARRSNHIRPTRFNIGSSQGIGSGDLYQLSVSPEIEYNFSEHVGILLGCWLTVAGKNTPDFFESTLKLVLTY